MLKIWVVLLGLVLTGSTAFADEASDVRRAAGLVNRGNRAFQLGDVEKAEKLLRQALEFVPEFPEAHLGLGNIAMTQGDFEAALESYEKARDGYAHVSDLVLELRMKRFAERDGRIRDLETDRTNIETELRRLENRPEPGPVAELRRTLAEIENEIQALRAMEFPDSEPPHQPPAELDFHRGNALFRLGRHAEALEAWEACAERDRSFGPVHNNLAVLYMMLGDYDAARRNIELAESLGVTVNEQLKQDLERRAQSPP